MRGNGTQYHRAMAPLILTVAPTGAETSPAVNPGVPITTEAIAADAARCLAAGAAIVHVHVRDGEGRASDDPGRIRDAVTAIRERAPGMVVNVSTAGALDHDGPRRLAALAAGADMCSLDAGSMNFGEGVFLNPPGFLADLARQARDQGVKPEIEVFDVAHVANALRLADAGLLEPPLWFQFVLGVPGGIPATADNLLHLVRQLPTGSLFSTIGIGRHQLPMTTISAAIGGHVRVGLEDNVYLRRGELATNVALVERSARIASELERPLASPAQVRELLVLRVP